MKGQLINTLKDAPAAIGNYKLTWNGTDESGSSVSSGIYFYKLAVDGNTLTRKMILIK
jgi:flagellar hook assembly protein FlgD